MSRVTRTTIILERNPSAFRVRSDKESGRHAPRDEPVARQGLGSSVQGLPHGFADASQARLAERDGCFGQADTPTESSRCQELLDALTEAVRDLQQQQHQSLEELQHVAVELAVAMASELVFRTIEAEEMDVRRLAEGAVHELGLDLPLTVHLHPEDLALLQRLSDGSPETPSPWDSDSVTLRADPSLPRGHCRATNGAAALLSELGPRLAEMRLRLLEGLDDAQTERRKAQDAHAPLKRFPDRRETA